LKHVMKENNNNKLSSINKDNLLHVLGSICIEVNMQYNP
jgi:hypothetical protein